MACKLALFGIPIGITFFFIECHRLGIKIFKKIKKSIYVANRKIGGTIIDQGDQLYLDGLHKDHIEVFDSKGKFKGVLNSDGTKNKIKTDAGKGRKLAK